MGPALGALSLALVGLAVTGCAPSDPTFEVSVTNGCDHAIELVVDDSDISLDELETLALYAVTYEPGQTEIISTVTGIDEVRLIAGVTRKEPTVLAVVEVSPSNQRAPR